MTHPMAGVGFAGKRSATMRMYLSTPYAAELQQPAISAACGDAQDAWVHRDFDFGYSAVSHFASLRGRLGVASRHSRPRGAAISGGRLFVVFVVAFGLCGLGILRRIAQESPHHGAERLSACVDFWRRSG